MIAYTKYFVFLILLSTSTLAKAQGAPSFGPETDVTINGLTFDAMEPFISADGTYLFFNNINDGVDTKLFYATRVNDSTFDLVGEVNGTNQAPAAMLLDAVPDLDTLNNFYWTSNRNYPAELDNLMHGTFSNGNVTNTGHVHGDFNMGIPGWLVMDHGVSYDGELLYFNNARFDPVGCQGPCETVLGVAQKVDNSTFMTLPNSATLMTTVNDTNFIYYAPCISSNNLELYYSRYPRDSVTLATQFDICVATRNSATDNFSMPVVLFSELFIDLIEAPTLTKNMEIMYYHRSIPGSHKIVMRQRLNFASVSNLNEIPPLIHVFPNPAENKLNLDISDMYSDNYSIIIMDNFGEIVSKPITVTEGSNEIDISLLSSGMYSIHLSHNRINLKSISFIKK
ncbi:MAG: hypothetical protein ACJA1C_000702 [Crocinitomicaceae bacterium]|jgi:hypothetical protein